MIEAVVEAAARLFADRGPAAVSLRDVATEANVNLGLIHRYIGSKEDLLARVLAVRPGPEHFPSDPAGVVTQMLRFEPDVVQYIRVFVQANLDGYDVRRLQPSMPILTAVAKELRQHFPGADADVRTVLLASMIFGWHSVGHAYLKTLRRSSLSSDELAAAIAPAIEGFLAAPPAGD